MLFLKMSQKEFTTKHCYIILTVLFSFIMIQENLISIKDNIKLTCTLLKTPDLGHCMLMTDCLQYIFQFQF